MAATESLPLGPETELARLASAIFAGSLTVADRDRLVVLLRDPQTRTAYRRIVWVHVNLLRLWGQMAGDMPWAPQPAAEPAVAVRSADGGWFGERLLWLRLHEWSRRTAVLSLLVTLGTALAVVGVLVSFSIFQGPWTQRPGVAIQSRPPRIAGAVAEVSAMELPRWAAAGKAWRLWDGLKPGDRVELTAGRIEIACDDGATIVLEGPAVFTMQQAKEATLDRGKATVTVRGANMEGPRFTLQTPTATLTDIGTSFGVIVGKAGETSVTVFDGLVDLLPRGSGASPLRLAAGEAGDTRRAKPARKVSPPDERFVRSLPKLTPQLAATLASLGWDEARATTIYRDAFNGSGPLNASRPGDRSGLGDIAWVAPAVGWQMEADGRAAAVATAAGSALLPFRPEPGRLYLVSAVIHATEGGAGFGAIGFTDRSQPEFYIPNGPWALQRNAPSIEANDCFAGPAKSHRVGRPDTLSGPHKRTILLDTTGGRWRVVFLVDGRLIGEQRYAKPPTICHVCLSAFPFSRIEFSDFIISSASPSVGR